MPSRLKVMKQWLLEFRQNTEPNTDHLLPQSHADESMNVDGGVYKNHNFEVKPMKSLKLGI